MFISSAFAQTAAATAEQPSLVASMFPLLLIMVIFYLLILRPQQKRARQHQAMIKAVVRGDKVLTAGGIVGKVTKVDDANDMVHVQIAEGVVVEVSRSTIGVVYGKEAVSAPPSKQPSSKKKEIDKPVANDN